MEGLDQFAGYTFSKAAQVLGVTEKQFVSIIKSGIVKENAQGLIDGGSLITWKLRKEDIESTRYDSRVFISRRYEELGSIFRQTAHREALEHYKDAIKKLEDERWEELMKPVLKERDEARAAEEREYNLNLKAIGIGE